MLCGVTSVSLGAFENKTRNQAVAGSPAANAVDPSPIGIKLPVGKEEASHRKFAVFPIGKLRGCDL